MTVRPGSFSSERLLRGKLSNLASAARDSLATGTRGHAMATTYIAPYINGRTIEVEPGALTPVVNPASGKAFSKIFMARPEHMTSAIDAAYAVKDVWGNTLPSERELILIRAADVLESMRSEV